MIIKLPEKFDMYDLVKILGLYYNPSQLTPGDITGKRNVSVMYVSSWEGIIPVVEVRFIHELSATTWIKIGLEFSAWGPGGNSKIIRKIMFKDGMVDEAQCYFIVREIEEARPARINLEMDHKFMKITPEIIEKIEYGKPLSDEELAVAIKFYRQMEEGMKLLGKEFNHARRDVTGTLEILERSQQARRE